MKAAAGAQFAREAGLEPAVVISAARQKNRAGRFGSIGDGRELCRHLLEAGTIRVRRLGCPGVGMRNKVS
jgi:hypothetical protein